ncbi:MAG: hypothetical protein AB1918_01285 [Pseudomonadota bacterium]
MATGAHGVDSMAAVRQVNDTLQGPVLDILSRLVPELTVGPRASAYERTLDDIDLLERCFKAFRRERARFRALLVDENRQPVAADNVRLSCGRTLDEVVAMVVRTAAKRYFRRRHDPANADKPVAARLRQDIHDKGFVHRVGALVKGDGKKGVHAKPTHSRADELYDAIKAHLLHDWQVPMVPTYAEMPPTLVRSLGAKILEVRDLDHLKRILDDPAEAAKLFDLPEEEAAAKPDAAVPPPPRRDERARLSDVLSGDSNTLRAEAFGAVLMRAEVKAVARTAALPLKSAEILRSVGAIPTKLLVAELGLRLDQLAVVLLVAHETVGDEVFRRIFGQPGNAEMVMRVTQRARAAGLNQASGLDHCAGFVRDLFARFST